ncbi:helix-turn-helix domain-containing protein [Actinomycetes bacterium KLBMP 9759]
MASGATPARVDAVRNRERILTAARELFAEAGIGGTSMNDVARRAGVGPGTLWRHFANQEELVAVVVGESLDRLVALADELVGALDGGDPLRAWTSALVGHIMGLRGFAASFATADAASLLGERCRDAEAAAARLVEHARASGAARADLTGPELIRMATAVAWTAENAGDGSAERLLTLAFDGMRPR